MHERVQEDLGLWNAINNSVVYLVFGFAGEAAATYDICDILSIYST